MPKVICDMEQCAYNRDGKCHAKSISLGLDDAWKEVKCYQFCYERHLPTKTEIKEMNRLRDMETKQQAELIKAKMFQFMELQRNMRGTNDGDENLLRGD